MSAAGRTAPSRLRIPALGVDAPVDPVGVDRFGQVTIPDDPDRVGWYRFGSAPGAAAGSAVLTGHVDSRARGAGALFGLRSLPIGSRVLVSLPARTVTYRVVARLTVGKSALPVARVFARTGPPLLTLVTCGGPFDAATHHYRDNVVVTAVPIP